jgi:deazaflavin-dependent oxidoreductase (nitroreductase family)
VAPPTRLHALRPFAVRYINPITRLFAGWLPGFALLTYSGRKSGRTYHTPINVLRQGSHYVFALTYGSEDSQWVKNILAAGECRMRRMGRDVRLVEPELLVNPDPRLVPAPLRIFGRLARVTEFVRMRAAP